jgi:hypothetical protein
MKHEEKGADLAKRDSTKKTDLPGYPIYPESEDIYQQDKEETALDPEQPSKRKA